MSEITVRQCDECGALHGAVNNWWSTLGAHNMPRFMTSAQAELEYTVDRFRLDYCSHKCVGTAFHRWLDTGSVMKAEHTVGDMEEYATIVP